VSSGTCLPENVPLAAKIVDLRRMRESSSSADAVDAPAKVTSARMSGAELKLALFRQSGGHNPE